MLQPTRKRSVVRRDPAIYADPTQHDDRLVAQSAYRRGCRCDFCKKHQAADQRIRYRVTKQRNPGRRQESNRAYRYGAERGQYEAMLLEQASRCKICASEADEDKPLVMDHCHATGRIRGLLCRRCNGLLGSAKDSPDLLAAAIAYLDPGRK